LYKICIPDSNDSFGTVVVVQGVHQFTNHVVESRAEAATGHHCSAHLRGIEVQVPARSSTQEGIARSAPSVLAFDSVEDEVLVAHNLVVAAVLCRAHRNIRNVGALESSS